MYIISDEPWNNPQFVIEVIGGSEEEGCVILVNLALKCKMQDREGQPTVRCFRILDPSNLLENKFSKDFFLNANLSKEYKMPPEYGSGLQTFVQRVSN